MSLFLGIDPGSRATGYGLVEFDSNQFRHIYSGTIRTRAEEPADKLLEIFEGIEQLLLQYRPMEAGIEKVFVSKNPTAALTLGQARGTAMVALAKYAVPVFEYSARQIKQAVVGYGAADKSQVMHMVKLQLAYRDTLGQDESDALACAICHAHTRNSVIKIKEQSKQVKSRYQRGRVK